MPMDHSIQKHVPMSKSVRRSPHIDRHTNTKVNTSTPSWVQEFFLQPIIKDRSNIDVIMIYTNCTYNILVQKFNTFAGPLEWDFCLPKSCKGTDIRDALQKCEYKASNCKFGICKRVKNIFQNIGIYKQG